MALPFYQYGVTEIDIGQQISFGSSIAIPIDGSGPFSITGWIRLHAFANDAAILSCGSNLTVGICGDRLYAQMAGQAGRVTAAVPISENKWHYFALTADLSSSSGTITLYLDGVQVGQASVTSVGSPSSGASFLVGGNISGDFMAFGFYAVALPAFECASDWIELELPVLSNSAGTPTPPYTPPSPVADFDLATCPPTDLTKQNSVTLLSGAQQLSVAQALSLYNAWAIPAALDELDPANGKPFSIQAWVLPFLPTQDEISDVLTLVSNRNAGSASAFALNLTCTSSDQLVLTANWNVATPFSLASQVPMNPGVWTNVAVTFDGTTMSLYQNGTAVGTGTIAGIPPTGRASIIIGGTSDPNAPGGITNFFKGGLQALGIWETCLSAAEVGTYANAEPTGQPNCVAYFDFTNIDVSNQVSGFPIQLYETADILEMESPASETAHSLRQTTQAVSDISSPIVELHRHAAALGIDGTAAPQAALLTRTAQQAAIDAYEKRLSQIPAPLSDWLRENSRLNLNKGLALHARDTRPLPGTFTHTREGDEWVIWHNGRNGLEECARFSALDADACTAWYISVVATAIGVMLSAVGVGCAAGKIGLAVTFQFASNGRQLMTALRAVMSEPIATDTFIKIVRTFYGCANLANVISSGIIGVSWWSFSWTVANVLLQIAAIWLTGGWWTAFIIGQLAISVGQLYTLMGEKPPNC